MRLFLAVYQGLFTILIPFIPIAILIFLIKFLLPTLLTPKGVLGERRVARILATLPQDKYRTINDILIPNAASATTQVDHIVVSNFGIFIIETKNFSGWIFGDSHKSSWTQRFSNRQKSQFQNPIHQNYAHIKAVELIIGGQYSDKIFSVVAFANKATINPKGGSPIPGVVYFSQLRDRIQSYTQDVISDTEVQLIVEEIRASALEEPGSRRKHVAAISDNLKARDELIASSTCPSCGQKLITRKGKYGSFIGCSGYPTCKFTSKPI